MTIGPAFVIAPIKKVRSCPELLRMSQPISPNSVRREVIVGSALALSSAFLLGDHHHVMTFRELGEFVSGSTIDIANSLQQNKISLENRLLRLKKLKAFVFVIVLPVLVRLLTFIGLNLII